jgi:hypothetical protein
MPLQDKSRPDRKQKRRKVICIDTGQIYNSASDMAEQLGITVQEVYNIIRRGQTYLGNKYCYAQEGGVTDYGSRTETENTRGDHAENG